MHHAPVVFTFDRCAGDNDDFFKSFLAGFEEDRSQFVAANSAESAAAKNRRNKGQPVKKSKAGCRARAGLMLGLTTCKFKGWICE